LGDSKGGGGKKKPLLGRKKKSKQGENGNSYSVYAWQGGPRGLKRTQLVKEETFALPRGADDKNKQE